jgi:hypothetical protein
MGFSFLLTQSPVLWIVVSALFAGAATSRLTRSIKKTGDPDRNKNRKLVAACILFSFSIASGLLALVIPGPKKILDIRFLYLFSGCTLFFFFFFRFRKAIMVPAILLLAVLTGMTFLFLQSITAFTGETEIARINVLAIKDAKMSLELIRPGNPQPQILEMEGNYFAPVAHVIIFDDLFVFLGAKTWYRFVGMSSFKLEQGQTIAVQKDIVSFQYANGISRALYEFAENNEKYIPIIKTAQTEVIQKKASELKSYTVRVENDGGVEVAEIK